MPNKRNPFTTGVALCVSRRASADASDVKRAYLPDRAKGSHANPLRVRHHHHIDIVTIVACITLSRSSSLHFHFHYSLLLFYYFALHYYALQHYCFAGRWNRQDCMPRYRWILQDIQSLSHTPLGSTATLIVIRSLIANYHFANQPLAFASIATIRHYGSINQQSPLLSLLDIRYYRRFDHRQSGCSKGWWNITAAICLSATINARQSTANATPPPLEVVGQVSRATGRHRHLGIIIIWRGPARRPGTWHRRHLGHRPSSGGRPGVWHRTI